MARGFVLKLGGSLARGPWLGAWLAAAGERAGEAVVVPGGGAFADAVRAAQGQWRFGEAAAHHMALLAMEQFGLMLAALAPGFRPAASAAAIRAARRAGFVPVWLPASMALAAPDLPASWDVTSDSLAAWLAGQLGIGRLVLVKSAPLADRPAGARGLAEAGVIDRALPGLIARFALECVCVEAGAVAAWSAGAATGLRLDAAEGR